MKLLVVLFYALFASFCAVAQPWFVKHQDLGTSHDYIYDMVPASDGGYIFTGCIGDSDTHLKTKLTIGKFDTNGDSLWIKKYGDLTDVNIGYAIASTSDGGYIVAGTKINNSAWLLRFNAVGDTLWTKEFANSKFYDVIETADGGFAAAGIERTNTGNSQVLFMITDAKGEKTFGNSNGGSNSEEACALVELPGGNFVVGGSTNGQGAGNFDIYAVKFNEKAVAIWDTTYGSTAIDRAYDMILDSNSNLVFAGSTNRNSDQEHLILKTDTLGKLSWENMYSSSETNTLYDIQESKGGGYIAIGSFYENSGWFGIRPCMLKTDSAGTELWLREYNSASFPETFACTGIEIDNNDIFLIGSGYDATFIKTDGQGTLTTAKTIEGNLPVSVFPNPTAGQLVIQIESGKYNFDLFNLNGIPLKNWQENVDGRSTINLNTYPTGVYLLRITNEKKTVTLRVIRR